MSSIPRLDGILVLVIEDNLNSLDMLKRVLESHGASVVTAGTGSEALRIVETNPPDVLLSDIGLPEMDGHMLLTNIQEVVKKHIPAAALTAHTSAEARSKSILAGFQFHIAKPVDVAELVKTVASLAGRTVGEAAVETPLFL